MNDNILVQLHKNEITPKQAYKELYDLAPQPKMKRAHFVKIRIRVPEEKGVSTFLGILFALPFPLFIVRFAFKRIKNLDVSNLSMTKDELLNLISYKGIKVQIESASGEKVYIKTL